jgi:hypothetical protein
MYGCRIPAVRMRRTKDAKTEQGTACDRDTPGA